MDIPQKRKYVRRNKPEAIPPAEAIQTPEAIDDIMRLVDRVFDDQQISNYHMVKSFIELCEVVDPHHHERLAMTLEGLIAK